MVHFFCAKKGPLSGLPPSVSSAFHLKMRLAFGELARSRARQPHADDGYRQRAVPLALPRRPAWLACWLAGWLATVSPRRIRLMENSPETLLSPLAERKIKSNFRQKTSTKRVEAGREGALLSSLSHAKIASEEEGPLSPTRLR